MTTRPVYTFDLDGTEKLLKAAGAAKVFEKLTGERPHIAKIRRLIVGGRLGIRLPSVMVGGARFTSEPAIKWWVAAVSAADQQRLDRAAGAPPRQRPPRQRPGRPSNVEAHRSFAMEILAKEPDMVTIEVLRRARQAGYAGCKSDFYAMVRDLRLSRAMPMSGDEAGRIDAGGA